MVLGKYKRSKLHDHNVDATTSFYKVPFMKNRIVRANLMVWKKYFTDVSRQTFVISVCIFSNTGISLK